MSVVAITALRQAINSARKDAGNFTWCQMGMSYHDDIM